MTRAQLIGAGLVAVVLAGCSSVPTPVQSPSPSASTPSASSASSAAAAPSPAASPSLSLPAAERLSGTPFNTQNLGSFDEPWALAFLPGGFDTLITQRGGTLVLRSADGRTTDVAGVPRVVHEGQGGLGDVIVSPRFATDRMVYLSWAAAGEGGSGAEVGRGRLVSDGSSARLENFTVIWRQQPKTSGSGHYGHRLAFSPEGIHLFVTSGERQKMDPAQDPGNDLGTIIRMKPDGSDPEQWTLGHRNPLGIAFDAAGNLWSTEMGPQGGDELNLIERGRNYGWPRVSNGSHYGGGAIPDHSGGDGFEAPKVWWTPSISPGSLTIYSGSLFADWQGDAFIGALSGEALIRVDLNGTSADKGDQWRFGARIRAVNQAPDGSIWVLEDGAGGRLLRLTLAG